MRIRLALLTCLLAVFACASARASSYVPIPGAPGPGPARYDRVFVAKYGPASAKRVLVLVPGYIGGAGDFSLIGPELVARVPNLQVWAVDRREKAFQDESVFRAGSAADSFAYYLPGNPGLNGRHYSPVVGQSVPFVRQWGLKLALEDLRRVVLAARAGGRRKVILGGHSLGASTSVAYATWDFGGHPGYRDLSGLVLIDGGLLGTFSTPTLAQVKQRLAALARSDPFVDLLGLGLPWVAGIFAEVGAQFALQAPSAASIAQQYPLLPAIFKPPFSITNQAQIGYAFDAKTSPAALSLIQAHVGQLAATGSPRPWDDSGALTPVARLATFLAHEPGTAVEWYFPQRLTLDVDGDNALRPNATTRLLGLRPFHLRQVNLPLYAFETSLTHGGVLRGARRFIASSRVRRSKLVGDEAMSHLDPLTATPARNRFLATVEPFLRGLR